MTNYFNKISNKKALCPLCLCGKKLFSLKILFIASLLFIAGNSRAQDDDDATFTPSKLESIAQLWTVYASQ